MRLLELHLMFAVDDSVETNDEALNALGEYLIATKGEPCIASRALIQPGAWAQMSEGEQTAHAIEQRHTLWSRLLSAGAKGRRFVSCGSVCDAPGLVVAEERIPTTKAEIEALPGADA